MVIGWVQHITDGLQASRLKGEPTLQESPLLETPLPETSSQRSPFRFHDLPLELHLQILETYVSTLYPRIVYRCFCHLCDPTPSTAASSRQDSKAQRGMHRKKYLGPHRGEDTKFQRRFSYCEDLPPDPSTYTLEHGEGRSFDYPYGTGWTPPEPGIFLTSKELRQQVIDVMMRIKPFYVFSEFTRNTYYFSHRYVELDYLPAWYRESLKIGEELRPDAATISWRMARWTSKFPKLQEVRLNYGRIKMNTKMKPSREKLEWRKGWPRELFQGMISRRLPRIIRGIVTRNIQGREHQQWDIRSSQLGNSTWRSCYLVKETIPSWEKNWKTVMLVEFRVRVRESEKSKRQWASIYVTARETKDRRTYTLDFRLDDRLLEMEKNVENCMYLAAQIEGSDNENGEAIY